ncbi:hypothetical protein MIR68_002510 [Amoeboaphelidium protococcarum]|nr:hypothetical protein MIR68_002510 [Amoeboaphelidium protococcarum]
MEVLYTSDTHKKNKVWHDGVIKEVQSSNSRKKMYELRDNAGAVVDRHALSCAIGQAVTNDQELTFGRHLVMITQITYQNTNAAQQQNSFYTQPLRNQKKKTFRVPLSQRPAVETQVQNVQSSQATEDKQVEILKCLYTDQIHKKQKTWLDGTIKVSQSAKSLKLFSQSGQQILSAKSQDVVSDADIFSKDQADGELTIDGKYLVQFERDNVPTLSQRVNKFHSAFKRPKFMVPKSTPNVDQNVEPVIEIDLTKNALELEALVDLNNEDDRIVSLAVETQQSSIMKVEPMVLAKSNLRVKFKPPLKQAGSVPTTPLAISVYPWKQAAVRSSKHNGVKFKREYKVPTQFKSAETYLMTLLNTQLECLQIQVNEQFVELYKVRSTLAKKMQLNNADAWRGKGVKMSFGCELTEVSVYDQENQTYSLTLPKVGDLKLYSKDDLWVVSKSMQFEQSESALFRSNWHGPRKLSGTNGTMELKPLESQSVGRKFFKDLLSSDAGTDSGTIKRQRSKLEMFDERFIKQNSTKCPNLVAVNLFNASSELKVIEKLKDLQKCVVGSSLLDQIQSFPLCPYIVGDVAQSKIKQVVSNSLFQQSHLEQALALLKQYHIQYKLNDDQKDVSVAFTKNLILSSEDGHYPITLCHGVFGAGKSYLLAVLIMFLHEFVELIGLDSKDFKVLLSSNTNVAVDRVLVVLRELGFEGFTRIGPINKIDKRILQYRLQQKARDDANDQNDEVKVLAAMMDNCRDDRERQYLEDAHYKYSQKLNIDLLKDTFLVGTTCLSTLNPVLSSPLNNGHQIKFPVVFLDECSQMTEALSLLPLASFDTKCALLIGDPLQLPPTLPPASPALSNDSDAHGSERTLFERVRDMGVPAVMLRTQYRCHPEISSLSNELFYDSKLVNGITAEHRPPLINSNFPHLMMVNISDGKEEQTYSGSYINQSESQCILKIVRSILQQKLSNGDRLRGSQLGVISLYKSQSELLSQIINVGDCQETVEVSTVDAYQGAEKDIIILSTVRSGGSSVGFIDEPRRINVALSRARYHLIIVANVDTVKSNDLWQKIIAKCSQNIFSLEQSLNLMKVTNPVNSGDDEFV